MAASLAARHHSPCSVLPVSGAPAMHAIDTLIRQVAGHNTVVLLQGESGSGKEVAARAIHEQSNRSHKPFVPVNCGAIPADLLESELFGHEKGAFTGAIATRKGRFELAEGGTLFLDEIGDMSLPMQVKLLRVLQERCFERVGSNQSQHCNVRIIAATHRDLEHMVAEGRFREDLFFRLNVFPIQMPALRDRLEDIPALVAYFNQRLSRVGKPVAEFSRAALTELSRYRWPGNIRELENLVERLGITQAGHPVRAMDLPARYRSLMTQPEDREALAQLLAPLSAVEPAIEPEAVTASPEPTAATESLPSLPAAGIDLKSYLTDLEVRFIQEALRVCDGVVSRAAKQLGLQRTTLVEKMKKLGLQVPA